MTAGVLLLPLCLSPSIFRRRFIRFWADLRLTELIFQSLKVICLMVNFSQRSFILKLNSIFIHAHYNMRLQNIRFWAAIRRTNIVADSTHYSLVLNLLTIKKPVVNFIGFTHFIIHIFNRNFAFGQRRHIGKQRSAEP